MGGQVTLQPVSEDDLPWLASLRDGPAATGPHEWHGWSDPQWERRQWAESGLLDDNGGTLIVLHGTDRVGSVSWRRVQTGPTAFNWAIGIGLAPEFRGRGYGTAAQLLVVRYLFAHTQANRIEATTEVTNVAEQRALEKAGFTREGILRGTTFRQGQWHDQVIYSVLRNEVKLEIPRRKAAWPEPLLRRSVCAAGQPARSQVSGCTGWSGSHREFPALTGRSGTQRARPLRPELAAPLGRWPVRLTHL